MALFGASPFPKRGDCKWKNETANRHGDRLPADMRRENSTFEADEVAVRDRRDAFIDPFRSCSSVGMYGGMCGNPSGRAGSSMLERPSAGAQVLGPRGSEPSNSTAMARGMLRKDSMSSERVISLEQAKSSIESLESQLKEERMKQHMVSRQLEELRSRPASATLPHSTKRAIEKLYPRDTNLLPTQAAQRTLDGAAIHPRPVAEWKPQAWMHQTVQIDPTNGDGQLPVAAARVVSPYSDPTYTGDIKGHDPKVSVLSHPITKIRTMNKKMGAVQVHPSQNVADLDKYFASGHVSHSTTEKLTYPQPHLDPRTQYAGIHFRPKGEGGKGSTGFSDLKGTFTTNSMFSIDPGEAKKTVNFKKYLDPSKKEIWGADLYHWAFVDGLKIPPPKPPHGKCYVGVHSGRFQKSLGLPPEDGARLMDKKYIPRAARSAVAALLGMEGTTETGDIR